MLVEAFKTVTTLVQRRFLLNALLPSVVFWTALLLVYSTGRVGLSSAIESWAAQDTTVKIVQVAAFLTWVWLFAGLIASQWTALVTLYSGDWRMPVLSKFGLNWHKARLIKLDKKRLYDRIYYYYPLKEDLSEVKSTKIGNILRSAQRYAFHRYKADWDIIWPRLYPLLPGYFLRSLEDSRAGLELTIVASALSGVFALIAGFYLILVRSSWWLFLSYFWGD
jgi:hypothetical protein